MLFVTEMKEELTSTCICLWNTFQGGRDSKHFNSKNEMKIQ